MKTKIFATMIALLVSCTMVFSQTNTKTEKMQMPVKKTMIQKDSVYYTCPMHHDVKMSKPGKCPKCGMALEKKSMKMNGTKSSAKTAMNTYTCSMHSDVKSTKPGKCPKCGMDLVLKK